MQVRGWEFWRLDAVDGGELVWLGITRPGARSPIDRTKVWTLVPAVRMFIANWFFTEDHARESGLWVHDNIDIGEACDLVGEVPQVIRRALPPLGSRNNVHISRLLLRLLQDRLTGKGLLVVPRRRGRQGPGNSQ
ncbi:MAG: hypothetical protein WD472_12205 [Dehalococcoidia bacterium]